MSDYGRRVVMDAPFETAVGDLTRAIRDEGLQVIACVDVRHSFRKDLSRDCRQFLLISAWSPDLAFEGLRHALDAGTVLPTTFAVYELADGETAVVAREPLSPIADDQRWRQEVPALAAIADRECERVARALARLQHRGPGRTAVTSRTEAA